MVMFSIDEWVRANATETQRWHDWFQRNPTALDVALDIAQVKNVREFVLHIVAVDVRYAERLCGREVTAYEQMPRDIDALFAPGAGDVRAVAQVCAASMRRGPTARD